MRKLLDAGENNGSFNVRARHWLIEAEDYLRTARQMALAEDRTTKLRSGFCSLESKPSMP